MTRKIYKITKTDPAPLIFVMALKLLPACHTVILPSISLLTMRSSADSKSQMATLCPAKISYNYRYTSGHGEKIKIYFLKIWEILENRHLQK